MDIDDVPLLRRPLALHPDDPIVQVEREVIASVLGDWLQYSDPELDRMCRDHRLCERSLVIRRVHEHMFACIADGEGLKPSRMCDEKVPSQ
jgi:hypothetical protein